MDELAMTKVAAAAEAVLSRAVEGVAVAAGESGAMKGIAVGGAVETMEAGITGRFMEPIGSAMKTMMGDMAGVRGGVIARGLRVGCPNEEYCSEEEEQFLAIHDLSFL